MKRAEVEKMRKRALACLRRAGIVLTAAEKAGMEVADFGLGMVEKFGLELVVYENNDLYCAKELVLLPRQTCPEHHHPARAGGRPGKQETFRCRYGEVYLYVPGEPAAKPRARIDPEYQRHFTVWHEVRLRPGDQYTLPQDTLHWFQAGYKGAVVSEFSSTSTDESDAYTWPEIKRLPLVED